MILSASRRTDIPAFFPEWVTNRLKEGVLCVRNPMNTRQVRRIHFTPVTVDCIVFWTKDPLNLMPFLPEIDGLGYRYYFQFTLTPYGQVLEPGLRNKREIAETFRELSKRIGAGHVLWRYDPVVFSEEIGLSFHKKAFRALCESLSGATEQCTISFVDQYASQKSRVRPVDKAEMAETAASFLETAGKFEITLKACCEPGSLESFGIPSSSCIDRKTIETVCGYPIHGQKDKNQRPGCGCMESIDIGAYNTCPHGCIYCYANHSSQLLERNLRNHNSNSPLLTGDVREADVLYEVTASSNRDDQGRLPL